MSTHQISIQSLRANGSTEVQVNTDAPDPAEFGLLLASAVAIYVDSFEDPEAALDEVLVHLRPAKIEQLMWDAEVTS